MTTYWQETAIAVGHDNYVVTNFETWFGVPLVETRVPLGSVTTKLMDGSERTDGIRLIELRQMGDPFGYTPFGELDAYLTAIHGGFDGPENVNVTLYTPKRDGTYGYFNAIAHLPDESKGDYAFLTAAELRDLRLRYTIVAALSDPEP